MTDAGVQAVPAALPAASQTTCEADVRKPSQTNNFRAALDHEESNRMLDICYAFLVYVIHIFIYVYNMFVYPNLFYMYIIWVPILTYFLHIYVYIYIYMHIYIYMKYYIAFIHSIYIYIYKYEYIYIYICTYIYIYIYERICLLYS